MKYVSTQTLLIKHVQFEFGSYHILFSIDTMALNDSKDHSSRTLIHRYAMLPYIMLFVHFGICPANAFSSNVILWTGLHGKNHAFI